MTEEFRKFQLITKVTDKCFIQWLLSTLSIQMKFVLDEIQRTAKFFSRLTFIIYGTATHRVGYLAIHIRQSPPAHYTLQYRWQVSVFETK